MTTDHIVKSFDDELNRLSDLISRMGGLAEQQIERAIESLQKRNTEEATQAIEDDVHIDELQAEIEELAVQMIVRRQPLAADLRHTVAGLKVAPLLERIGDYAKNIARRTLALNQSPPIKPLFTIPRMGRMARTMVQDVLDALSNNDVEKARAVWERDAELDDMYDSLFREMLTYMMEDPRNITPCTHLLFVARNIERIGDIATNIAEIVHYQVEGEPLSESRPKADEASVTVVEPE
ncbi:MAG: phosphate signaling complex protein PhoU [Alphaproteobacteria bacterium]|nr:phosphate signaling complex protein PhoU [Alphaproteobacteria bacterium]